MKPKKNGQGLLTMKEQDWSPQALGLDPARYDAALRYLFDRPVPQGQEQEWFWELDEPEFEATPLEWTRIQTVLFANAGRDLAPYNDEQIGMGLNYVMSNSVSNVPHMANEPSVPLDEAMKMMAAMPRLWHDCIGPRLASVRDPIGSSGTRLGFVCYMWFDVWPTFWIMRNSPPWQQALWNVFREMLQVPFREVQIAALHGIGHHINFLDQPAVDQAIASLMRRVGRDDEELTNYAQAARTGCVQ